MSMLAFNLSAAEFSAQPILGITTEIDDNKRLLVNDAFVETTVGLRTQAEVKLLMLSEDTSLYITPIIGVNRYSEEIGLDTETTSINVSFRHLINERNEFNLLSNYSIQPVTLQTDIIDPISLSVAGLNFDEIDQERLVLAPSYTYFLNERVNLGANFSYTDVQFDAFGSGFNDYENFYYGLQGSYILSEKDSLSATVYRTEFKPITQTEIINHAFQVTYTKNFSETLRTSIGLGLTFAESESLAQTVNGPMTVKSDGVGELIALSLEKQFENMNFSTTFDRRVSPTVQGNERINDDFRATISRQFSNRLSGNIGFRYLESGSGVTQQNNTNGSEFSSVTTILNYRLSRHWTVSGGYSYRQVEDINSNNERDSNNVFLKIRYVADKIIFN